MAFFHSGQEIVALKASSGKEVWRTPRSVNRRRPSWSAPTLVIHKGVVLCGDRAVDAVHPGADPEEEPPQWVVNAAGGIAPPGKITAFDAADGQELWESSCREVYNAPVDVLVADDLVWSGNLVRKGEPGITEALDFQTGAVSKKRPKDQEFFKIVMGHHRCYRNKATQDYLVLGRDGVEFIDVASGEGVADHWVRGACQYGVMPCNGLLYAPPHSCACHIEDKLNSFNALSARGPRFVGFTIQVSGPGRVDKGPVYTTIPRAEERSARTSARADWPTFRHDMARSGATATSVPTKLAPAWEAAIGGELTTMTAAKGKVFVCSMDDHTVHCLDAETGEAVWRFTAGGPVDSPPTIYNGAAIFGCTDGYVYCLRAADGALAWRYRAALENRRMIAYDRLESVWPLHGSVLIVNDVAYVVAGRSAHLDGGLFICQLNPGTAGLRSIRHLTDEGALSDVLACDSDSIYLRHRRFDANLSDRDPDEPHLYSPAGFLDGSWWHRTYWQWGTRMGSDYGHWPVAGSRVPAGRLMVKGAEDVYGFGRLNQYSTVGSHVGLGKRKYVLYASPLPEEEEEGEDGGAENAKQKRRREPRKGPVPARWQKSIGLLVRGMVLCRERTLFVAGPPDLFGTAEGEKPHPYAMAPAEGLREQEAAWRGERGGVLQAVSAKDGSTLAEYKLKTPPVFDGVIAANGRLYVAGMDGSVVCFAGQRN